MKPYIALCVGHSRFINGKRDGGAVSVDRTSEWNYNCDLAEKIKALLLKSGIRTLIISDYPGTGYLGAMQKLAGRLRQEGATYALELHFNASDSPASTGHEWLYWHTSTKGKSLAKSINQQMSATFPKMKARGETAITPDSRGAAFLNLTHCPAVICEPGFGSNANDWKILTEKKDDVASAIAKGVKTFLGVF